MNKEGCQQKQLLTCEKIINNLIYNLKNLLASVVLKVNKHNCATTPAAHAIKLMQIKRQRGERRPGNIYEKSNLR